MKYLLHFKTINFIALLALFGCSEISSASTVITSTIVPAFSGGNFSSKTVSGLHQFDPALGVLSGIEFKVVNSYDVDITYDTEVIRPNRPHDLNVRIPFQISLSVPTASGGGSLFATATNSVVVRDLFSRPVLTITIHRTQLTLT